MATMGSSRRRFVSDDFSSAIFHWCVIILAWPLLQNLTDRPATRTIPRGNRCLPDGFRVCRGSKGCHTYNTIRTSNNNYSVNTTCRTDCWTGHKRLGLVDRSDSPPPTRSRGWHFAGAAGFSAKYHNNPLTFTTRSFPPERIADRLTDARVFILCTLVCVGVCVCRGSKGAPL